MATRDENASVSSKPCQESTNEISTPIDTQSPSQTLSEDPTLLPLTRRHTSKAWEHYKRKRFEGDIKAECNYCQKLLAGGPRAGTSHLREHTKCCPKKLCKDLRQTRMFGAVESSGKNETLTLAPYEFQQEYGRKDLAEMIILHEYSLSMVEHFGFRKYSKTLQPGFKVPSRNTVKKDIIKRYGSEKENVLQLLNKTTASIALTTDMWTSSNQRKGYMAITAHFIDNGWKLQSRILRFLYVPPPYTADVLCRTLLENCIYDWNLDLRLSTITVDNYSTNDAMMDVLWEKLPYESLMLAGQFLHMRCCAHIVNLIVQQGLSVIGDGLAKVRNSVLYWTASPSRVQNFESLAKKHVPSCQKKLVLDCKTRWNSTYEMLKVAIIYKDVFDILKGRESDSYKYAPSKEEWELAEKICDKLELFNDVTEEFSASKHPPANIYFSNICEIRVSLNSWLSSPDHVIRHMASCMLEKYNKYWIDVNGLLAVAAILDPRYKISLVRFYFKKIYDPNDIEEEVSKIRSILRDLIEEYALQYHKKQTSTREKPPLSSQAQSKGKSKGLMNEFAQFMEEEENRVKEKSDLEKYLEDPNIQLNDDDDDFDILAWWKANGSTYPILQHIARDILSIPVSIVPSECAFSTGGRILSPHRSRLLPTTVEAMMCAQNWIWTNIRGEGKLIEMEYPQLMEELEEEEEEESDTGSTGVTYID